MSAAVFVRSLFNHVLAAHDDAPYSAVQNRTKAKDKKIEKKKREKEKAESSGDIYKWLKDAVRSFCCSMSSARQPTVKRELRSRIQCCIYLLLCVFNSNLSQNKFKATQRTSGVSTTDLIVRILQNYEDYVDRSLRRGVKPTELHIGVAKANSILMKKNLQQWGEKVSDELTRATLTDRPLGSNFDEGIDKFRNSVHHTYDVWSKHSKKFLEGFARTFEPMRSFIGLHKARDTDDESDFLQSSSEDETSIQSDGGKRSRIRPNHRKKS
eukprot:GHVT01087207.1.p1 GENE.GHVT01087207.1~~GHVT01087207.1.p1  ORF type:complete len:268 (-),score=19.66 GHVT01087207.1:617-1420(-)